MEELEELAASAHAAPLPARCAFLGFMSAESGLRLLDRLEPMTFPEGQTIQAAGLAEDCWYLIEQGTVQLEGDQELGPGATFGERAWPAGRSADRRRTDRCPLPGPDAARVRSRPGSVAGGSRMNRGTAPPGETSGCRNWNRPTAGWRRWRW